MRPTTNMWSGWLGALRPGGVTYRFTWEEWHGQLRQGLQWGTPHAAIPPGRREIAARAFLAWFDTAPSNHHDSPFDDRERAVRHFMRGFDDITTTFDQFSAAEMARLRLLRSRHRANRNVR